MSTADWCFKYVETARALGLVSGVSEERFGAGGYIMRQDAAVMLFRAMGGYEPTEAAAEPFEDMASVAEYAREAVSLLQSGGLINGADGKFLPRSNLTKAEAAALLYNAAGGKVK